MEEVWDDDVHQDEMSEESIACETIHRFLKYQEIFGVYNWLEYMKQSDNPLSAKEMTNRTPDLSRSHAGAWFPMTQVMDEDGSCDQDVSDFSKKKQKKRKK